MFCVFSGTGVARLRDYLNGGGTNTPMGPGDGDSDDDEDGDAPPLPPHQQMADEAPWALGDQDGMDDEDMDEDETIVDNQSGHQHADLMDVQVDTTTPGPSNNNTQTTAPAHGLGLTRPVSTQSIGQDTYLTRESWEGLGTSVWPRETAGETSASGALRRSDGDEDMGEGGSLPRMSEALGAVNMADREEV